jgi:uncharacterized protein (TIGR03437 family)
MTETAAKVAMTVALLLPAGTAQLIAPGAPVPHTSKPPVVFLNGYQQSCPGSFTGTFGAADQILQSNGEVSLFFDNCSVPGKPPIETLAAAFATFLAGLKYDDGKPVDVVDVVAHSMGGLIVRSYLSGKQTTAGAFQPPEPTHIGKAVFVATPNFGTGIASLALGAGGSDPQLQEMASGSAFLFELGSWNQDSDDLHGVDAVAVAGNGGTGRATTPGFDDGVVALTSASLGFYLPGRTRVIPYCHIDGGGLISFAGLCASDAPGIARMTSSMQATAQIVLSFFNGDSTWQSVGVAAEQDPLLSRNGGLLVTARTSADADVPINSAAAQAASQMKTLNVTSDGTAYTDMFAAGPLTLSINSPSLSITESTVLPATVYAAVIAKAGPLIARVLPAASTTFPLNVAPGEVVAIYGINLAAQIAPAAGVPLPVQLSDAQVLVNGAAIPLYYASTNQINAVFPNVSGLVKLTVRNSTGSHTLNVLTAPAVPAVFTQDGSGAGPASVQRFPDYSLVTASNPLHPGEYAIIYLTGLGGQPATVTIGGQACAVVYSGPAAIYPGLDQINCQTPSGVAPSDVAELVVSAGGRTANITSVALR